MWIYRLLLVSPMDYSHSIALTMFTDQLVLSKHFINAVLVSIRLVINSYIMFILYNCLFVMFSYMLFQLYFNLHAQYLSSTDAYAMLNLVVM